MRLSNFIAVSCRSNRLVAARLTMNASGRCELADYRVAPVAFESTDADLWLKAASQQFPDIARSIGVDGPVGFALPGRLTLTKYLKIPQAPAKKRQRLVAYEARQNIPYPIGEVTWDDFPIFDGPAEYEALVAAIKTELAEALCRYGKESGLEAEWIEPSYVSLLNGFRFNYPDAEGTHLLASLGAKSTDLVYAGRERFFTRNVAVGLSDIATEIAETLGAPLAEADRLKKAAAAGETLPAIEQGAYEAAAQRFSKRLGAEIARTTALCKRQGFDLEPAACLLAGEVPDELAAVEETLGRRLAIPVSRYDPLRRVRPAPGLASESLEADKALLGEAAGLAIGRFLPDAVALNLLPRSLLWQRKFKRQQPFYIVAGLVACAAVSLPIFNSMVSINAYEQEIQNLDAQLAPLIELDAKISQRSREIDRLESLIEEAEAVALARPNWLVFLNDLQERLLSVEDVWIDRLKVERPEGPRDRRLASRLRASSRSASGEAGGDALLLKLEGRLIDVNNPLSTVSQDSYRRVKALLESFSNSAFVASLKQERFDNSAPGILHFSFTLAVSEARPL